MAILPLFRSTIFSLITLLSLVVLGICAHLQYRITGYMDIYTTFVPFGLGVACLTVVSLPLFLSWGNLGHRVFTSTILFETIWFLILWLLWVGTAGDTVAGKAYYFPSGCIYDDYPDANQFCHEITVVEAFAFFNFGCAFIYYDVIFLYAIISAIRGKGIWTASVKEAATGVPVAVNPSAPIVQPQFTVGPAAPYQNYGAYPPNAPPTQPYIPYLQQVPPQGPPTQPYPQQVPLQVPPPQPYPQQFLAQVSPPQPYPQQVPPQSPSPQQYSAYPQQVPPQSPPSQQYNAYPQQAPPQSPSTVFSGQNQPYNYVPSPNTPQEQVNYAGYSPSPPSNNGPLPPQLNYGSHPVNGSQAQLPLPGGYQGQPVPEQQLPSPYGPH